MKIPWLTIRYNLVYEVCIDGNTSCVNVSETLQSAIERTFLITMFNYHHSGDKMCLNEDFYTMLKSRQFTRTINGPHVVASQSEARLKNSCQLRQILIWIFKPDNIYWCLISIHRIMSEESLEVILLPSQKHTTSLYTNMAGDQHIRKSR